MSAIRTGPKSLGVSYLLNVISLNRSDEAHNCRTELRRLVPLSALQAKTTAANSRIVAKMILVSEIATCRAHFRRQDGQNASWHLAF